MVEQRAEETNEHTPNGATSKLSEQRRMHRYAEGRLMEDIDEVAVEFPLTIRVNWEEFATIVCTPSHMEDLVLGFLASESVIRYASQVESLSISWDQGFAYVKLDRPAVPGREFYAKRMIGSCCGKSREFYFVNDARTARTIPIRHQVSPRQCFAMMTEMERLSESFHLTGGLHNAALFGADECLAFRSDIGRHNALDKLYGFSLRSNMKTANKTIAFSGRISSEVILKASKIGVGLLLSKSAPSDLALRLADDLGITAVGFIRGGNMNVYTHPERIRHEE